MNQEEQIIRTEYSELMQKSYIDYAMSVIIARALPDVRDGLKPVQRRTLYDMYELGIRYDKPYRKCARIVGDTMGKYHPHGDSSIYDGLQRASQVEYDWVLIIDDDAMIAPDYMEKLLDYANAHTGIYGLAGKVVTEGHIDVSHRRRIINRLLYVESNVASEEYQKESFACDAATFCGLLLQGKKMREIGLPQKGYFLWYDDIEYCLRLQECGGVTVVPAAVLHHKTVLSKEGMVTKGVLHRIGWRQYYGYRNRYDTAKRHLGSLSAWVILWQYRVFWLLSFFMTWKKETREQGRSNQKILHDVIKDCKAGKLGKHPEYHY